jgi:hypothetical protein
MVRKALQLVREERSADVGGDYLGAALPIWV